LARALGDCAFQPMVTCDPDVGCVTLDADKSYRLVVACDGVFDVAENRELLRGGISPTAPPPVAAARLRDYAYALDSKDNITTLVVDIAAAAAAPALPAATSASRTKRKPSKKPKK
jgi:serine/threonine protein phosphatase PrpC